MDSNKLYYAVKTFKDMFDDVYTNGKDAESYNQFGGLITAMDAYLSALDNNSVLENIVHSHNNL